MTTTRHEAIVDAEINEAAQTWARATGRVEGAMDNVHRAAGDRTQRPDYRWGMPDDAALDATTPHAFERYRTAVEVEASARVAYADASVKYTGWSRFYYVTNTGGHIHRSTGCSTCHPTTRFAWLTDLSGLSEADAVEAHGAILCTVCFPSAPVEWTGGVAKVAAAAQAARAAERAAKATAKTAKAEARALTHHYGLRKVRASDGEVFDDSTDRYAMPTTLKAATRRMFEERGPFWTSVHVIDLNTGEVLA
jgi:hypothetical protein